MDKRLELINKLVNQQTEVINIAIDLITTCTNPTEYDKLKLLRFKSELNRLELIISKVHETANDIRERKSNNE